MVFFFLHYGPIMFSRSTLAQNSLFTWLFPASADSSPKSSQPSSYVAISATGAASSLADPKTAISPGSTCNLSADTLAAWHQPYHDFHTCCVFIFLWQIHTIFIHLHVKATCWPLISETEIFMIDSQNHSNESLWMDVSRNLACFRECQGFFYDIHVDHCEPMASRVFSKTKPTYSMPLSHELEALPWRHHSHLHTPKIPSPRSALIFMCRARDIRSIPLRFRKLFSSSELL